MQDNSNEVASHQVKSLAVKLAQVMQQVKYIQKRGFNKFHKYHYATEADVNEAVQEHFSKLNIIMIPSLKSQEVREVTTRSKNTEYVTTVHMDFTLIDGDSGESLTFSMSGSGQDPGDKGIFKAISGCQKYALMKMLMIPTGDDPELDEDPQQRGNTSQQSNKTSIINTLKAKWEQGKGTMDGFDAWYNERKKQGDSDQMIDAILTKSLKGKKEEK